LTQLFSFFWRTAVFHYISRLIYRHVKPGHEPMGPISATPQNTPPKNNPPTHLYAFHSQSQQKRREKECQINLDNDIQLGKRKKNKTNVWASMGGLDFRCFGFSMFFFCLFSGLVCQHHHHLAVIQRIL